MPLDQSDGGKHSLSKPGDTEFVRAYLSGTPSTTHNHRTTAASSSRHHHAVSLQALEALLNRLPLLLDLSARYRSLVDPLQLVNNCLQSDDHVLLVMRSVVLLASGRLAEHSSTQSWLLSGVENCVNRLITEHKLVSHSPPPDSARTYEFTADSAHTSA